MSLFKDLFRRKGSLKDKSSGIIELLSKSTVCDKCSTPYKVGEAATRAAGGYLKIACPSCGSYVIHQIDADLSFLKEKELRHCNYCSSIVIGEVFAIPEDRRSSFEEVLGKSPELDSYEQDSAGQPQWVVCTTCLLKVQNILR